MTDPVQSATIDATDGADAPREPARRTKIVRRAWIVTLVVAVLLALGAGRTVMSRIDNSKSLETGTAERAKQYVKVTSPKSGASGETVALPGTLQGHVQSPIAARASGYLKRWYKDIGARVNKGDVLAEIETPEIDQQLSQAIAARDQAASSLSLAKSTMERWEALRKKDAVSQQELDERRSNDAQARSNLAAAAANVERLRQLGGFKRIVAPFAGVITKRNVDTGDLIDAGANRPLFLLAQTDPLRVYLNVPQTYAHLVKAGQPVIVTQAEIKGQQFNGVVERTSGSIDPGTRTMQVEISLANKDGRLLPGAYVQVALPLAAAAASDQMTISANTLMFRGEGIRVAIVDAQGRIHLSPVKVGRNLGESVEVIDGIKPVDKVVLNPSDSLAEGDQVSIAAATVAAPASGAKGSAKGEGSGALPTGSAPAASPASVAPTPPTQPSVPGDGRKAVPQTSLGNGMKLAHSLTTTSRAGTPAINAMAVDTPTNVAMRTNIATPTNIAAPTNTATPTNVPALADATPARPAVR